MASGSCADIIKMYHVVVKQRPSRSTNFPFIPVATSHEQTMFDYIRPVVVESLRLSIVHSKVLRRISMQEIVFQREILKTVILRLVHTVGGHISKEVRGTKGDLLYYNWYRNGTH